jgi:hypothetical protein
MRIIINETQLDLILNEQMGVLDVMTGLPETGQEVTGLVGQKNTCEVQKTDAEVVLEIFTKAKALSGQPSQSDKTIQSWVSRISKSIEGIGITSDFTKVLTEIKTAQQLGSVLNAYYKKFKRYLYQDLSSEYTISWRTILLPIQKYEKTLKINTCKKYNKVTQSA